MWIPTQRRFAVLSKEEIAMTKNLNEYIDIKNIRHTVNHLILPSDDQVYKEKILEEIRDVLIKKKKKFPENSA